MPTQFEDLLVRRDAAWSGPSPLRIEELREDILRSLALSVTEARCRDFQVKLERRLRDRAADEAANLRIWRLVGLSFLLSAAIYLLLTSR